MKRQDPAVDGGVIVGARSGRAARVALARDLRAQGLLVREIAELMGRAVSTVDAYLNDPDLSKQQSRRERYALLCVDCGEPTDGSGGYARTRTRCHACDVRHRHESRRWTQRAIIAALQAWARELGRQPTAIEGVRAGAPVKTSCVQREFGSWNAGIEAAGFTPRGRGERLSYRTRKPVNRPPIAPKTESKPPAPTRAPKPPRPARQRRYPICAGCGIRMRHPSNDRLCGFCREERAA